MERIILWSLLIIGITLLFSSLRKPPIKNWIIIFSLSSYFSTFVGVLVVEEKMLEYPVRFLSNYFSSSLLYEYLLFPVVCIYFYQTTYGSRYLNMVLQCILYTTVLTIIEVFFERYTELIKYHTWTWIYTFISTFILMMFIRFLMQLINSKERYI
ncbi:CBO0543 family protein [Neobacillus sp. DY30]|uniref:CBO0543 family protein n=1 Tax=Neobacillus sp. DY30 TaxID=3047871 RepID=UPI0024C0763B|nr:CBO0543 family protein [Neobacillus sp. DY30]WHY03241.1 CBO0543 family protein [Neobacillus sp. DY30]